MRKPIIAGNWKMNKTAAEAVKLIEELKPLVAKAKPEVVVCVPFTDLAAVGKAIEGSKIKLGAQNVAWADKGAFTGEISAEMLKELGVEYVVIGHSERRQYFGETDESVNKRVKQALANGLKPIVCVGETKLEREKNRTKRVLKNRSWKGLRAWRILKISSSPMNPSGRSARGSPPRKRMPTRPSAISAASSATRSARKLPKTSASSTAAA